MKGAQKIVCARGRAVGEKTEVELRSGGRKRACVRHPGKNWNVEGDGWWAVDETGYTGEVDSNLTRMMKSGRNPVEIFDDDFNRCNI